MPCPHIACGEVTQYELKQPEELEGATTRSIANEVSYIIHNTFVDYPATRPPSLEEFFHPRLSKSVPSSGIEEVPCEMALTTNAGSKVTQTKPQTSQPESSAILRLVEMLTLQPQLELGELPSFGSRDHSQAKCKPCAFIWTQEGCKNGSACAFCHLCEPGEKKRRQKERKKARAMAKLQQSLFSKIAPSW